MKIDFSGRRVLVTGSTNGIGFAAARGFLAAGAQVTVNGRSGAGVEAAIARLAADGPGADRIAADLASPAGCDRLVAALPDVDILVNNLGVYGPSDFFATPDAEWERVFQINIMSGIRLARAYGEGMARRGWGRIVFVSSESALNIPANMIHYGVTKTAQLAISRGLAKRLAGTGVTVNAVLPGPTLSEGVAEMLLAGADDAGDTPEALARSFIAEHRPSSILRRAATVDEVASMILYVASDQASATTGAALRVDGGVVDSIV